VKNLISVDCIKKKNLCWCEKLEKLSKRKYFFLSKKRGEFWEGKRGHGRGNLREKKKI
jgi:hypothetical protein